MNPSVSFLFLNHYNGKKNDGRIEKRFSFFFNLLKKCKVYHFGKEAASIHFKPD